MHLIKCNATFVSLPTKYVGVYHEAIINVQTEHPHMKDNRLAEYLTLESSTTKCKSAFRALSAFAKLSSDKTFTQKTQGQMNSNSLVEKEVNIHLTPLDSCVC